MKKLNIRPAHGRIVLFTKKQPARQWYRSARQEPTNHVFRAKSARRVHQALGCRIRSARKMWRESPRCCRRSVWDVVRRRWRDIGPIATLASAVMAYPATHEVANSSRPPIRDRISRNSEGRHAIAAMVCKCGYAAGLPNGNWPSFSARSHLQKDRPRPTRRRQRATAPSRSRHDPGRNVTCIWCRESRVSWKS